MNQNYQWMVEPTLSYRLSKYFEPLAGVRYNNLSGEIRGPGILPTPRVPTGTQDWWDPIVGANLRLPLGKRFYFDVRGDIGGFGAGSDFTWQAFPSLGWQFAKWGSVQAGYRWLYMDYETGSAAAAVMAAQTFRNSRGIITQATRSDRVTFISHRHGRLQSEFQLSRDPSNC